MGEVCRQGSVFIDVHIITPGNPPSRGFCISCFCFLFFVLRGSERRNPVHMTLMGRTKKNSPLRNLIQKQSHRFQIQTWFRLTGLTCASATGVEGDSQPHVPGGSPPSVQTEAAGSGTEKHPESDALHLTSYMVTWSPVAFSLPPAHLPISIQPITPPDLLLMFAVSCAGDILSWLFVFLKPASPSVLSLEVTS